MSGFPSSVWCPVLDKWMELWWTSLMKTKNKHVSRNKWWNWKERTLLFIFYYPWLSNRVQGVSSLIYSNYKNLHSALKYSWPFSSSKTVFENDKLTASIHLTHPIQPASEGSFRPRTGSVCVYPGVFHFKPPPTNGQIWCCIYLSCSLLAWQQRCTMIQRAQMKRDSYSCSYIYLFFSEGG